MYYASPVCINTAPTRITVTGWLKLSSIAPNGSSPTNTSSHSARWKCRLDSSVHMDPSYHNKMKYTGNVTKWRFLQVKQNKTKQNKSFKMAVSNQVLLVVSILEGRVYIITEIKLNWSFCLFVLHICRFLVHTTVWMWLCSVYHLCMYSGTRTY